MELKIIASDKPEVVKEACDMAKFLRKNGVSCRVELPFSYDGEGEDIDIIDALACTRPIIDAEILSASPPLDRYIRGLDGAKKYLERIKKFVQSK